MNHSVGSIPSFVADPIACLQAICNHGPSLDALPHLAGRVAGSIKEEENSVLSSLYVKAAARHLSALADHQQASASRAATTNSKAAAVMPSGTGPQSFVLPHGAVQEATHGDIQQTQHLYEISEALCYAAMRCQPRSAIVESGILTVLQRLLPNKSASNNVLIRPGPSLNPLQPDLLHLHLCADQAQEAQLLVSDEWPRPTRGVGVIVLLRYFYLRGMVHIECQNWEWAIRCFWTCLVIPADSTSALVIAAWKKLVLLQALSQSDRLPSDMTTLLTPKTIPVCVSRFISQAINSSVPSCTTHSGNSQQQQQQQEQGTIAAAANPPPGEGAVSVVTGPEDVSTSNSTAPPLTHLHELTVADSSLLAMSPNQQLPTNVNGGSDAGIRAYSDLVRAFVKVNRETFGQVLVENENQFTIDGNLILVKLVENELLKRQIYQWSRVVSAISMEQLGGLVSMPVTELQILLNTLAENHQLKVEVMDQIVYFPKHLGTATTNVNHAEDLAKLTSMMQKLDVSISTSPRFISLVRRDASTGASGEGKASGPRGVEDV